MQFTIQRSACLRPIRAGRHRRKSHTEPAYNPPDPYHNTDGFFPWIKSEFVVICCDTGGVFFKSKTSRRPRFTVQLLHAWSALNAEPGTRHDR